MEKHKRLEFARRKAGYGSRTEAAKALGIGISTYTHHENDTRDFDAEAAEIYARKFKTTPEWLLYEHGDAPDGNSGAPGKPRNVEILAWVTAGKMQNPDASEILGTVQVGGLPIGDWIALRVQGDSMDLISPPDSVIIVNRKDRRLVNNGCYVIEDSDGSATYKRYRPNPPRFEPVSSNKSHESIFFDNEPTVVGRVRRSILEM